MDEKLKKQMINVMSDLEQFIFVNSEGDLIIQRSKIIDRLIGVHSVGYLDCRDEAVRVVEKLNNDLVYQHILSGCSICADHEGADCSECAHLAVGLSEVIRSDFAIAALKAMEVKK